MTTAYVTCPLCEATCGLTVTFDGDQVREVRGDPDDVFSRGYICPKGVSLGALQHDKDRLRAPLVKRDGEFVEVSWDEAFAEIEARLLPIIAAHGKDAVGLYAGNPSVHNLATTLYGRVFYRALGSRNFYTASTVDQMPKHVSAGYMFGGPLIIPVPDLDRTSYLLMLGANPLVSNGSLMTAADVRGRLRGIQKRGGKVVVIDPRRSRTAELADEHHAIRPGTDAHLLFAMVNVLFAKNLVRLGRLAEHVVGIDGVRALAQPFTPEAVAPITGIDAETIRTLTHDLAAADGGCVYGRIGTTTQAFGTLASWLVDVLNVLTGHLDQPGGAMFPTPAAGADAAGRKRRGFSTGRWTSRVRGLREVLGEMPVAALAEEILTPGEGQIRALITVAGNPCLSTPNGEQLTTALEQLEFMISLDVYLNETTRHADVILPGPAPLERPHYDIALYQLAVRNIANWTPAVLPTDLPQEWETFLRLTGIISGLGSDADIAALDDFVAAEAAKRYGVDVSAVEGRTGPARLIDIMLRGGPYDLTLADLEAAPHGIDLGPLTPRIPDVLATQSGKVELAPAAITGDVPRLVATLAEPPNGSMVLIGRRQLRSNNSWMHNIKPLVTGSNRCTVHVHPEDAGRLGLVEGGMAKVSSRVGTIEVPVEVTDAIRAGVVSIPHGWGHDVEGIRTEVAAAHPGVNTNVLADDLLLDVPSGTSVLNGIPVVVEPA